MANRATCGGHFNLIFTLITAQKPRVLSKSFSLEENGSLLKHAGGQLTEGTAETRTCTVQEFASLLHGLSPNHALAFGITEFKRATVVPHSVLGKRKPSPDASVIARDREHFRYPDGPGVMMLDYDPQVGAIPLDRDNLLQALCEVLAALKDHPHIWTPSASSCIHRTDSSEELRGIIGQRVYAPVQDARDIPRAGDVLFRRLWLAGHGRFDVSKSGALLERSIIDASVWQPERLDFAGGAACGLGLEQRRPEPIIFNADVKFLDTRKTLPDLTQEEEAQLLNLKSEARKLKRPEVETRRAEWIEDRLAEVLKEVPEDQLKMEEERLREIYARAVEQKRLMGDFRVHSERYGVVTVAQVLDNPKKFHNTRFADPLEPHYGNDPRIALANLFAAGKPCIYSHAHGGQKFSLHRALSVIRGGGGELRSLVDKAMEIVRIDGALYDRGGELVRMAEGKVHPVEENWLLYYIAGLARFEKQNRTTKELMPIDCPQPVARTILQSSGEWRIPKLSGIITTPIVTLDNRLIESEGYDHATGLYLDFPDSTEWRGVPKRPDDATLGKAVKNLWIPFAKFPFAGPVDRGGFLAAALTAAIRPVLPTAPGFYLGAPVAGSGKTFLASCLSILAGGNADVIPRARGEEEMRKRLFASARHGSKVLLFDNFTGELESDSLSAFLTTGEITDRVMGLSRMVTAPANALTLFTGNNLIFVGDLNRRIIRIEIDPECEKPHERLFDLDPRVYTREHRLSMTRDILTILRGALQTNEQLKDGYGSYDEWSAFIRKAVVWVGTKGWLEVGDPLLSISAGCEQDPDVRKLSALMSVWKDVFGERGGTVPEAIRKAGEANHESLSEVLRAIAGEKDGIDGRKLGKWIAKYARRIVEGRRLTKEGGTKQGSLIWVVSEPKPRELRDSGELFSTHAWKNKEEENLYWGMKNKSQNSSNSPNLQPVPAHFVTCYPCANFISNETNPSFQGRCNGYPPDGERVKFPHLKHDCPEFRERETGAACVS